MKNFLALLIFAGGGAAWYSYHQYSEAKAVTKGYEKNLALHEQSVSARTAELQAYAQFLELQKLIQGKQAEIAAMSAKDASLQKRLAQVREEKMAVIAKARQAYVGQTWPELVLADGRRLQNVKVMKVEDGGLSVITTTGVQKITAAELPPEMRQKLHYGP